MTPPADVERVSIVGGGITGASLAYRLSETALDVSLYERGELGEGATAASMAVFSWQSLHPTALDHRLRRRSWAEYERFVEEGRIEFTPTGALDVATTPEKREAIADATEKLRELGVDAETLDPEGVAAFGIAPHAVTGALYIEREGCFDPDEVVAHYAKRAAEAGVRIETDTEVTGIETEDGAVSAIETPDEATGTDVVVNAAGPWAPAVNDLVGLTLALRRTRGPILDVQDRIEGLPFTLFERADGPAGYLRSHESGVYAGRYATDYESGEVLDPDRNYSTGEEFRDEVGELLETYVPDLAGSSLEEGWVGIRTVSPDGLPLVGDVEDGGPEGFVVACGPSGLGITRAPAIADLLGTYLETGRTPEDLLRLSPTRFTDVADATSDTS